MGRRQRSGNSRTCAEANPATPSARRLSSASAKRKNGGGAEKRLIAEQYRQRFLARHPLSGPAALQEHSRAFERRHNQTYRYSKLQGRTPAQSLQLAQTPLRWPATKAAPRAPLGKPRQGRYHLIRFIRSDRQLNVFGEKFELPVEATYEYVVATVEVAQQKLQVRIGEELIHQVEYRLF